MNGSATSKALAAREGNVFQGLGRDVAQYLFAQNAAGADYAQIHSSRIRNNETQAFGGGNFSYSPEISQISSGMLDVMAPYLETQEATQFMGEQYDLLKGAQMFSDNPHNGTALMPRWATCSTGSLALTQPARLVTIIPVPTSRNLLWALRTSHPSSFACPTWCAIWNPASSGKTRSPTICGRHSISISPCATAWATAWA